MRNGRDRTQCTARLHRLYRSLSRVLQNKYPATIPHRTTRPRARNARGANLQKIRRYKKPPARLRTLRRARLHARHDGYRPQSRSQRQNAGRTRRKKQQQDIRTRFIPTLYSHVRQCRPTCSPLPIRGRARRSQTTKQCAARYRPLRSAVATSSSCTTRNSSQKTPRCPSRKTR